MTLQLVDVPSAVIRPPRSHRSPVRRELIDRAFGRRALLKSVLVGAGAFALATFEGVMVKIGAAAVPATHDECSDWQGQASNGWWPECNPLATEHPSSGGGTIGGDQIGNEYCGGDNYHRTDSIGTGSGRAVHYERRPISCADKNAWVWKLTVGYRGWQNKRSRRCSDGRVRVTQDGDLVNIRHTVCVQRFPNADPEPNSLQFDQYTPDGCPPSADDSPHQNPEKCLR